MFLALAYLEEDGIALLIAQIAGLVSLAITAAMLWRAVETVDWLDPARRLRPGGPNREEGCSQHRKGKQFARGITT